MDRQVRVAVRERLIEWAGVIGFLSSHCDLAGKQIVRRMFNGLVRVGVEGCEKMNDHVQ